MHKVQLYVIPTIIGLLFGFFTAILWILFWTLVIPWPAHEAFASVVGTLGALAAGAWTLNGMLRWGR